jgi:hypothetical protein
MRDARKLRVQFIDDNPPTEVPHGLSLVGSIETWEEHLEYWQEAIHSDIPDLLVIDVGFGDDNTAPSAQASYLDVRGLYHGMVVAARILGVSRDRPLGIGLYSRQASQYADDPRAQFAIGLLRAQMGYALPDCRRLTRLRESILMIPSSVDAAIEHARCNFYKSIESAIGRGDLCMEMATLEAVSTHQLPPVVEWRGRFGAERIEARSLFPRGFEEFKLFIDSASKSQVPFGRYGKWLSDQDCWDPGQTLDKADVPVATQHRWMLLWCWWRKAVVGQRISATEIMERAGLGPQQADRAAKRGGNDTWALLVRVLNDEIGRRVPECVGTIDWLVLRSACRLKMLDTPFTD